MSEVRFSHGPPHHNIRLPPNDYQPRRIQRDTESSDLRGTAAQERIPRQPDVTQRDSLEHSRRRPIEFLSSDDEDVPGDEHPRPLEAEILSEARAIAAVRGAMISSTKRVPSKEYVASLIKVKLPELEGDDRSK